MTETQLHRQGDKEREGGERGWIEREREERKESWRSRAFMLHTGESVLILCFDLRTSDQGETGRV